MKNKMNSTSKRNKQGKSDMSIFQRLVTALVSPCAPHIVRNLMSVAEKMNLKKMTISRYMCMDSAIYIVHVYVHIYIYISLYTQRQETKTKDIHIYKILQNGHSKSCLWLPPTIFSKPILGAANSPKARIRLGPFSFHPPCRFWPPLSGPQKGRLRQRVSIYRSASVQRQ